MEIGILGLFIIILVGILFVEKTAVGERFITWVSKTFMGIDLDELED